MLSNPKWFKRRKYSGWGLTPATWQGWLYIGMLICGLFSVFLITTWLNLQTPYRVGILLSLLAFIVLESMDTPFRIDKDERESAHEAFAERNAAWVMVMILVVGVIFQSTVSFLQGTLYVDPFLAFALLGGVVAKGISNWYFIDK